MFANSIYEAGDKRIVYASTTDRKPNYETVRLQEVFLGILEGTILALYVTLHFVDLSFLGIYEIWVSYMFGMLMVALLVLSLKMFSRNRLLALIGLGVVAVIVVSSLLHPFLSSRRR